jgi:hypothetical protein
MIIPDYLPITNNPRLFRHTNSRGVINTDKQARSQYIIQKNRILGDRELLNNACKEIANLKADVAFLKLLATTKGKNEL